MASRSRPRRWRLRGRRAQVSAVATILGLLLVVTFVANYLTTTLPNQMQVNDLNHELAVENQVGRVGAILESASAASALGAQLSQPISLGSSGDPPFANPDSGQIGSGNASGSLGVTYSVLGPLGYAPPVSGGPAGGHLCAVTCSGTATSVSIVGSSSNYWNMTGNSLVFTASVTGSGFTSLNLTANSSTLTVSGTGSGGNHWEVLGSHDTISMSNVGSGVTNISVIGNYDQLALTTTGSSPITVWIYGSDDSVTFPSTTGSQFVKVIFFGTYDTFSAPTATGSQSFAVRFNGFSATSPTSSLCPYANLSSTDAVTGFNMTGSGGLSETLNNVVGYSATGTGSGSCVGNGTCWSIAHQSVTSFACPFFSQSTVPIAFGGEPAGIFSVQLTNAYIPSAAVGYDLGAVTFAQEGGYPIMVSPPDLAYTGRTLSLWIPQFQGSVGSTSGIGTVDLNFRLLSVDTFGVPGGGYSLPSSGDITLTVVSPYAQAWYTYFQTSASFHGLVVTCTPASVCSQPFQIPEPLGTVTLTIPISGLTSLSVTTARFSVAIP